MSLTPGYGETPVSDDELDALLPAVRELLGEPVTKAAVYDLEQAVQEEATEELLTSVLVGNLSVEGLLTDHFVRDLHLSLYGDIWTWAGVFRKRELNVGIAPEQIAVEPRGSIVLAVYYPRREGGEGIRMGSGTANVGDPKVRQRASGCSSRTRQPVRAAVSGW